MGLLPVGAALDGVHHQVFGGQEGQVFHQGPPDDLLVDPQAAGHVAGQAQHRVGAEEALRQGDPPVGGIVQGALQPLGGGGHGGVQGIRHQIAAQGADPLAAHGVTLIGHG